MIWEDAGAATLSGGAWAGATVTPQMTSLCGHHVHPVSLGSREERAAHVLPPGSEPGPPHPLTSLLAPQPQGQLPLRVSAEKVLLTQQPASLEPLGPEARTEPMAPSLPLRLGPALGGPPACVSLPARDCAYCRSGWGLIKPPKRVSGHPGARGAQNTLWAILVNLGHVPRAQQLVTHGQGCGWRTGVSAPPPTHRATDLAPCLVQAGTSLPLRLLWLPSAPQASRASAVGALLPRAPLPCSPGALPLCWSTWGSPRSPPTPRPGFQSLHSRGLPGGPETLMKTDGANVAHYVVNKEYHTHTLICSQPDTLQSTLGCNPIEAAISRTSYLITN